MNSLEKDYYNRVTKDIGPSQYLGDGCYVQFLGYRILLYTSDGINIQDKIYLEDEHIQSLVNFTKRIGIAIE